MSPHKTVLPSGSHHQEDLQIPSVSPATLPTKVPDPVSSESSSYNPSPRSASVSSLDDTPIMGKPLRPGVYVPTLAFFRANEDLDLETISKHAVRLAKAGVAGITTQGSNGEAVHLNHQERQHVTRITRKALNSEGFESLPIIVGCGAQSTRETIELCREALSAGGDYALVLAPSYYLPSHKSDTIIEYFTDVANASPIPILIYNYPAVVAGIDLSSDIIIKLAKHPNIVGCKLTCGNTGKLSRIATATNAATPTDAGSQFMCMGGSADFTLQTLIVGGSGVICGVGNIAPKACIRIVQLFAEGKLAEAKKVQAVVARGDWAAIAGGILGTKCALETYRGYGGIPRRPLPRASKSETLKYASEFREILELENALI